MNEEKLIKLSEILDENNQYIVASEYISIEDDNLEFNNILFDKKFRLEQDNIDIEGDGHSYQPREIKFLDCKFEITPYLYSLDSKYLTFSGCKFDKITYEDGLLSTKGNDEKLGFSKCEFDNIELAFDKKQPVQLYGFNTLSGKIKTLIIYNAIVDTKFKLYYSQIAGSRESLKKLEIDNLRLMNIDFKDDFALYSCNINTIDAHNVTFEQKADFSYSHFSGLISSGGYMHINFENINFKGFTIFDHCEFDQKVTFKHSSFEDSVHFKDIYFKKGLNLDYANIQKNMNFYNVHGLDSKESKVNTTQETYRIIKYNLEKIGNKIEANRYHSLELNSRRKNIWKTEDSLFGKIQDSVVYWVHYISSNHSMSWILPLFWIFTVSLLTSCFIEFQSCKMLIKYTLTHINNDFTSIYQGVLSIFYLKYISIFSGIDIDKNPWTFIFHKSTLGYLYYQFLTAIRKDTNK